MADMVVLVSRLSVSTVIRVDEVRICIFPLKNCFAVWVVVHTVHSSEVTQK